MWLGKSRAPLTSRDGKLEVRDVTLDDTGDYTCVGRNLLGAANQTTSLIVEGKFQGFIHFLYNL